MKFILFILTVIIIQNSCVFALETDDDPNAVFLNFSEDEKSDFNINNIKKGTISRDNINLNEAPLKRNYDKLLYQDVNRPIPRKKSVSKSLEKNINENTIFGTSYKTTSYANGWNDSLSLYSKYKKDRFSFTSSYIQKDLDIRGKKRPGSVSLTPELKINDHISLKNIFTNNITDKQRKNEVVISLKPFKDGRMDLDLGAGQTYSLMNEPSNSHLKFSTRFRF